jgi:caa(3)-type oxidase subunit IV
MSSSTDSHGHGAHAGDHGHDDHDVSKDVRTYMIVGGLLLAFTLITVGLSYVDFGKWFGEKANWNMLIGMAVALFKGTLVAAIFMHLRSERWTIYRFLILTVIFVAGLFLLTALAFSDRIHL